MAESHGKFAVRQCAASNSPFRMAAICGSCVTGGYNGLLRVFNIFNEKTAVGEDSGFLYSVETDIADGR